MRSTSALPKRAAIAGATGNIPLPARNDPRSARVVLAETNGNARVDEQRSFAARKAARFGQERPYRNEQRSTDRRRTILPAAGAPFTRRRTIHIEPRPGHLKPANVVPQRGPPFSAAARPVAATTFPGHRRRRVRDARALRAWPAKGWRAAWRGADRHAGRWQSIHATHRHGKAVQLVA